MNNHDTDSLSKEHIVRCTICEYSHQSLNQIWLRSKVKSNLIDGGLCKSHRGNLSTVITQIEFLPIVPPTYMHSVT